MTPTTTIRDGVNWAASPAQLRVPAFEVINRVQRVTPSHQILGTAVALVAMCEAVGLDVKNVLTKAHNSMAHTEGPFTHHVQAIRQYATNEIHRR